MILPEALPILFNTNKLPRCTCVLAHAVPVIITEQQWRTEGGGGGEPPSPKFPRPPKTAPNTTRLGNI